MFYKNIDTWSKGKLRIVTLIVAIAYFTFLTFVPCVIVGIKYNVFSSSDNRLRLTGALLIIIILLISAINRGAKLFSRYMPEVTPKQQGIKFIIELVSSLIVPLSALFVIHAVRVGMDTALDTLMWCVWSYIVALIIFYLFLKTLLVQWKFMGKVDEQEKLDRIKAARK